MSVSVFLKNVTRTTGEGPVWDARTQTLVYVDIGCGEVHRYDPVTGEDQVRHIGDQSGFIVPRASGGYVTGRGRDVVHLDWESSQISKLAEVPLVGTNNRLNDAKCDPQGRLWAGTMGHFDAKTGLEKGKGALFSMGKDHQIRTHLEHTDISNGMDWTTDNKTMYFIDTIPKKVYAFDFDLQNGSISNQRVAVDIEAAGVGGLGPDGCCLDADDQLWVAVFGGSKVVRFDMTTGKAIQTIDFPASRITCCSFGGPNLDEMYVTSARGGLSEEQLKLEPLAGSVFKVTGLGVKGKQGNIFQG